MATKGILSGLIGTGLNVAGGLMSPEINAAKGLYSIGQSIYKMGVPAKDAAQNVPKENMVLPANEIKTATAKPSPPSNQVSPIVGPNGQNANVALQTQGLNSTTQPQYSGSGGAILPQGGQIGTPLNQPQNGQTPASDVQPNSTKSPYVANGGVFGQIMSGLANNYSQPSQTYQDATAKYQNAVDNLSNFRRKVAGEQADISQVPIELGFQQGRQQILTQKSAQEDAALQNAVNQQQAALGYANSQQQLQQSALGTALGAAGTQIPLGNIAPYLGIGTNDAAQNYTNYQIIQNNAATGNRYAGQAVDISNSIARLDNVTPKLVPFLESYGLNNQSSPFYNKSINEYLSQSGSAGALQSWSLIASDLEAATRGLLGTTGANPLALSQQLSNFDPSQLKPQELQTYIAALNAIGQYQLGPAQSSSYGAYNANTGGQVQPYVGGKPANTTTPLPSSTTNPVSPSQVPFSSQNPLFQGAAGAAMNMLGGVGGVLQGLIGYAASFL